MSSSDHHWRVSRVRLCSMCRPIVRFTVVPAVAVAVAVAGCLFQSLQVSQHVSVTCVDDNGQCSLHSSRTTLLRHKVTRGIVARSLHHVCDETGVDMSWFTVTAAAGCNPKADFDFVSVSHCLCLRQSVGRSGAAATAAGAESFYHSNASQLVSELARRPSVCATSSQPVLTITRLDGVMSHCLSLSLLVALSMVRASRSHEGERSH